MTSESGRRDVPAVATTPLTSDDEMAVDVVSGGGDPLADDLALPVATRGGVAGHMIATVVGNLFPPLALLVTAPILAHSLGVTGRGQVAGATAPLILVTTAITLGVPQALTFAVAKAPLVTRLVRRRAVELIVLAGVAATLAVVLLSGALAGDDPELPTLVAVAALAIIPGLVLLILRATAAGLHRWRAVALEQFISSAAELVVLVILAVSGTLTPLTAVIVLAFSPFTGALAYLGQVRGMPSDPPPDPLSGRRHLMSFGVRVWIGSLSGIVLSRLDQTLMTPLSDARQLGFYATAVTVSQIPLVINSAVRDVIFAADAADSEDGRLGMAARISSSLSALVGLTIAISMIWWLPILFGNEFSPAIHVGWVLIVAVVLGTPGSIAGAGLGARNHPGLRSISLIIACVVNFVLVMLLVPPYGAMGAAWATLIGNLFSANGCILFLWRKCGVHPREMYGFRRSDITVVLGFLRDARSRLVARA